MSSAKPAAKKTSRQVVKYKTLKVERLSMRIDRPAKAKLERAAAYVQKSVSEYVVDRALEAAETDITMHEKVILSENTWETFFNALKKPPKASSALRALLAAHDQTVLSR